MTIPDPRDRLDGPQLHGEWLFVQQGPDSADLIVDKAELITSSIRSLSRFRERGGVEPAATSDLLVKGIAYLKQFYGQSPYQ